MNNQLGHRTRLVPIRRKDVDLAHPPADRPTGGIAITRRALLGVVLATAVVALPVLGAGTAHADGGTGAGAEGEEYDIPDDIGSAAWW